MQQLQKIVATLKHGAAPQNKGRGSEGEEVAQVQQALRQARSESTGQVLQEDHDTEAFPCRGATASSAGSPRKAAQSCGRHRLAAQLQVPSRVKEVFKCRGRPPHFRCSGGWTACQTRIPLYQDSVFAGLRLSPVDLVDALYWYTKCSQSQCPRVTSCIAACTVGRTTAEHILGSLRDLEASAGQKFCAQQMLKGNIEADATALSKFYVRASCETYKSAIDVLKTKLRKVGVQCRDGPPIVFVPEPAASCLH